MWCSPLTSIYVPTRIDYAAIPGFQGGETSSRAVFSTAGLPYGNRLT